MTLRRACLALALSGCATDYTISSLDVLDVVTSPDAPTARCNVAPSPVAPPHEAATWIGDGSTDPKNLPLTYRWRLEKRPVGSSAQLPAGAANLMDFKADMVGTYVASLVVENSEGMSSAPCEATLEAISAEAFRVEMFWDVAGDDMDLHLMRSRDDALGDDDCHYANCVPPTLVDWGAAGEGAEDPTLDLDDIEGMGPENINIVSPGDDRYLVAVHDYPGSVMRGANKVTVNIYVDGEQVWTDTRTILGENDVTWFAEISWPSGEVTSL